MFTSILFLYLSFLVSFKDTKIRIILLEVNLIAVVLKTNQASKQTHLMTPLTDSCNLVL